MYFSRVQLDAGRITAPQLSRLAGGDQYLPHQLLWRLFSSGQGADRDKQRTFIYRAMDETAWPAFYLLSKEKPAATEGYWKIDSKIFEPVLSNGTRLRFDLRANPVKRSTNAEGRQHRHDVVMDLKHKKSNGSQELDLRALEHEAAHAWLSKRANKLGFSLVEGAFVADSYRQHRISRGGKRAPIRFSSLDMRGVLEVTDAERLRATLFNGIGPAKSFGCGLLLVRPA